MVNMNNDNPVYIYFAEQVQSRTRVAYQKDYYLFLKWLEEQGIGCGNGDTLNNTISNKNNNGNERKSVEGICSCNGDSDKDKTNTIDNDENSDTENSELETLKKVNPLIAASFRDWLIGKNYKPATICRKLTVMNGVFRSLKAEGIISRNPFEWIKRPRMSHNGVTPAFSKEQVLLLLNECDTSTENGKRDRLLLLLLFYCALRRSEVVYIQFDDFYEDSGYVVLQVHGKGRIGKIDKVKVPRHVYDEVLEYKSENGFESDNYLFHNLSTNTEYQKLNKPISPTRVYLILKKYCEKAGLDAKHFTAHSTRATAITLALDGGASLRQVQLMARHSDPKTTIRYDRNRWNLKDNAVDYLDFE